MQKIFTGLFLSLIVTFLLSSPASAIDCTKASTSTERTICKDKGLKELDQTLNTAYNRRMNTFQKKDLREQLKDEEKEWIKIVRTNCAANAECLKRGYQTRISSLNNKHKVEARASDSDDVIPLLGNWKSVKYTLSSGVGAWSTKEADRLTAKEFQFSEVELRINGKTQCKDPKYKVSQIELEDFVDPDQAIPSGCGVLPALGSLKLV